MPKEIDPVTLEKLQSLGYLALSKGASGPPLNRSLPDPKDKIEIYELIRHGTKAAQQKDFDRAVRDLSAAVSSEPGSLIAHFQLGNVFRVLGALDKAEREFQKALELRPDYTLALRRLAEIYLAGKRYREAETALTRVLAQSPSDFLGWFNLGGLYVTEDRWDEALVAFQKAQALNSRDAKAPLIVGRILLRKGNLQGALEAALQAAQRDPNLLEAHLTALEVYRKLGRPEEAEKEAAIVEKLKSKPQ